MSTQNSNMLKNFLFAVICLASTSTFAKEGDGLLKLNDKKAHLKLRILSTLPLRFFLFKNSDKTPVLELNSRGLEQMGQVLCGWPGGKFDPKRDGNMVLGFSSLAFLSGGKSDYKPCPQDQPVKSTWGDGGTGGAALFVEIEKKSDEWAEVRVFGKSAFLPLKPLGKNYDYLPAGSGLSTVGD
jgi:hypothetical protein